MKYDGSTWSSTNFTNSNATALGLFDGTLYAGSQSGYVYEYDAADNSWSAISNDFRAYIRAFTDWNGYLVAGLGTPQISSTIVSYKNGEIWTALATTSDLGSRAEGLKGAPELLITNAS